MASSRRVASILALVALVALAGCGQLLGGGGERRPTETLTPAPVPDTATATQDAPRGRDLNATERYAALRPTCARPPSVVVHIQVAALANNDPATNDGIRTTWRFAAPSNRQYTGPYENFEDLITSFFQPLLRAETVTYGPMTVADDSAERRVTVTANGTETTYRWQLTTVTEPPYEGCWMTTGVSQVPTDLGGDENGPATATATGTAVVTDAATTEAATATATDAATATATDARTATEPATGPATSPRE